MDPEKLRGARDKLTRVFRYLEALNQHRNPAKRQIREQLWNLWLYDLPDHPSIKRGGTKSRTSKIAGSDSQDGETGASFVLRVQRPALTSPPPPPAEIGEWLEPGWDDPSHEVSLLESWPEPENQIESRAVKFADSIARPLAFQRWKALRDDWARNEKPARVCMKIFETLYALYGRIDREAERVELVLGDGILSWSRPRAASTILYCSSASNCSSMLRCPNLRSPRPTIPPSFTPPCSNR